MANHYKVFFHHGHELTLKTRASKGEVWIDTSGLNVRRTEGDSTIPLENIREVEMFRLHGMARVIRVDHQGGRVYFAVVRFMIGQFASVNFFKTGELHQLIQQLANPVNAQTSLGS